MDLFLLPFSTLQERSSYLKNQHDKLQTSVSGLRNSYVGSRVFVFFTSIVHIYMSLQDWSAPQILVDVTEAYSAVATLPFVLVRDSFANAMCIELIRNPIDCVCDR